MQNIGLSTKEECDHDSNSSSSEDDCCAEFLGEGEGEGFVTGHDTVVGSSNNHNLKNNFPPEEILDSLINGNLSLPHSKQFSLPPVVACPGGCQAEHYCR